MMNKRRDDSQAEQAKRRSGNPYEKELKLPTAREPLDWRCDDWLAKGGKAAFV